MKQLPFVLFLALSLAGCTKTSTPNVQPVLLGNNPSQGYDLGCATSTGLNTWIFKEEDAWKCDYPVGQQWGSVFITASDDGIKDYSSYKSLVLELKAAQPGGLVNVSVRANDEPTDGSEPMEYIKNLTTEWQTVTIPLTTFVKEPIFPATRFTKLHVVCLLTFPGNMQETICFRNVRFTK